VTLGSYAGERKHTSIFTLGYTTLGHAKIIVKQKLRLEYNWFA